MDQDLRAYTWPLEQIEISFAKNEDTSAMGMKDHKFRPSSPCRKSKLHSNNEEQLEITVIIYTSLFQHQKQQSPAFRDSPLLRHKHEDERKNSDRWSDAAVKSVTDAPHYQTLFEDALCGHSIHLAVMSL